MSDVSTPSPATVRQIARLRLVRNILAGTDAMRGAAEAFLPREAGESHAVYQNRLNRSVLFNGVKKTMETLAGKVFRRPVALGPDVPTPLVAFAEDIDRAGRNVQVFARDVFEAALADGITYVLVDFPKQPPDRTLAEEREAGVRPYVVHLVASDIIGFRTFWNGADRIEHLRYRERITVADGEFGEQEIEQIRVLKPGAFELWRKNKDGAWFIHESGETSMPLVPVVSIYAGRRLGPFEAEPPLADLAHLNAAHWRSSSDQAHILHTARVPILVASGWPDPEDVDHLEIGPNTLVVGPAGAKLEFVEHSGKAIEAGRADIEALEAQMAVAGMELLVRRPGNPTATARAIDAAEADSALAAMAMNLQDGLEAVLGLMARWIGLGPDAGGSVTVNRDFGAMARDTSEVDALLKVRVNGDISRVTFLRELHRRGVLAESVDPDIEAEAADDDSLPDDLRDAA